MKISDIDFIAHQDTSIGTLILRRIERPSEPGTFVTEITLDHEFLMSSHVTVSERALSRIALDLHPGEDLQMLVGGLGLGYTAFEALRSSRVSRLEVVEFVPAVIEWMRGGLVPLSEDLCGDARFEVSQGSVFERLAGPPAPEVPGFDLILIDVDHAPDDHLGSSENDAFYTAEGLRLARRHLAPNGVLAVWSYAQSSPFVDALRDVFADVRVEPVTFFNEMIGEEITDWLFFARD